MRLNLVFALLVVLVGSVVIQSKPFTPYQEAKACRCGEKCTCKQGAACGCVSLER